MPRSPLQHKVEVMLAIKYRSLTMAIDTRRLFI